MGHEKRWWQIYAPPWAFTTSKLHSDPGKAWTMRDWENWVINFPALPVRVHGRRQEGELTVLYFPQFCGVEKAGATFSKWIEVSLHLGPRGEGQQQGPPFLPLLPPPSPPQPQPHLETAELQLPCGQRKQGCAEHCLPHCAEQLQRWCISAAGSGLSIHLWPWIVPPSPCFSIIFSHSLQAGQTEFGGITACLRSGQPCSAIAGNGNSWGWCAKLPVSTSVPLN